MILLALKTRSNYNTVVKVPWGGAGGDFRYKENGRMSPKELVGSELRGRQRSGFTLLSPQQNWRKRVLLEMQQENVEVVH